MKKIAVVIHALPFNTTGNAEALRCAVGLTIEDENKVQVLFINDGVWTAASLDCQAAKNQELDKHVETLLMMEVELMAEEEALTDRGIKVDNSAIITRPRAEINQIIRDADVVIGF